MNPCLCKDLHRCKYVCVSAYVYIYVHMYALRIYYKKMEIHI